MLTKSFLIAALFFLSSAGTRHLTMKHATDENTFLLKYIGKMTGPVANFSIKAQLSMDSSIGFRYDVSFQNGTAVLSHIAVFHKFSSPYQTTFYNYLNHKSEVIKPTASNASNNVEMIGKEKIDSFSCTHLRHAADNRSEDYWMSTAVPGFSQLCQILKHIDPSLMSSINETIFNWGGLVKIRMVSSYPNEQSSTFTLNLIEAKAGLVFQPTYFDVPGK
jgi:hypothetical protein